MAGIMNRLESPHGHTPWDLAYSILNELGNIRDAIQLGKGREPTYRRIPFTIDTDGAGNGSVTIDKPRGIRWDLIAGMVGGSPSISIYVNSVSDTNLLSTSAFFTSASGGDKLTADDTSIIFVITAGTANSKIGGNLRVLQHGDSDKEPRLTYE